MKLHVVDECYSDFDMLRDGEVGDIIHHRTFNQEGTKYYRIVLRDGVRDLVEEPDFEEDDVVNPKKKKRTKHMKARKLVVNKISRNSKKEWSVRKGLFPLR